LDILHVHQITLLDTLYFGKVYVCDCNAIEVCGPCNAMRAKTINSKHNNTDLDTIRAELSPTYFFLQQLLEHAVIMVNQMNIVQFLLIGNWLTDPNDC